MVMEVVVIRRAALSALFMSALIFGAASAADEGDPAEPIWRMIELVSTPLLTQQLEFEFHLTALPPQGDDPGAAAAGPPLYVRIARHGLHDWSLQVQSPWATFELLRDEMTTWLILPEHKVAFRGRGELGDAKDTLAPQGLIRRLITADTSLFGYLTMLSSGQMRMVFGPLLEPFIEPIDADGDRPPSQWRVAGVATVSIDPADPGVITVRTSERAAQRAGIGGLQLRYRSDAGPLEVSTDGLAIEPVDRAELEQMIVRAARRGASVAMPGPAALSPPRPAVVPHGELRQGEGQTLVLLHGSGEQMGRAHAALLADRITRTRDSTLYLVGLVETVRSGKWFIGELEDAWRRLGPHIPDRHKAELAALAGAHEAVTLRELQLANVFPEYFHCSGFALFGSATADGELYHGRVLDYMTMIGLQQSAVTFVCKPDDRHGFINVGYAGFLGSVSGMNDQQISVGEMGGAGRYEWDGVPMATLMRRALEECSTLGEVRQLWQDQPRTCEYYYVFADGKIPAAVGVKATPNELTFVEPGQFHPQLGEGFEDAMVMSAGSRLKVLRQRVSEGFGRFDLQSAIDLMDRPVAMSSNLHNALFLPRRGQVWIANAGANRPAADMPYVKYDLNELLGQMGGGQ